jgi:hypothetical protein
MWSGVNLFSEIVGLTFVQLSKFTLLIDQVKTSIEKWFYFLNNGGTWNFEKIIGNDANMFGNDANFKRTYKELDREH